MRLNGLDFLSSSPHSFIFRRRTNQTNLGGFLSLIYLLILLIISGFYLIYYFNEDNYFIQYIFQEKPLTTEEIDQKYKSEKYNPFFNICSSLYMNAYESISKRFGIRRYNSLIAFTEVNTSICHNMKIPDLNWIVVYDCLNKNETECQNELYEISHFTSSISLYMYYNGFILDHQNKTEPLYRMKGKEVSHSLISKFDLFNPSIRTHTWTNVRYKEEKGFSSMFHNDEDNDYIGLIIKSYDYSEMSGLNGDKRIFIDAYDVKSRSYHKYKVIGRIKFDVDFAKYDEYKRTPKSFWDTMANICSLCMTILNAFSVSFMNYFSDSFDNYKIMQKILVDYNNDKDNDNNNDDNKKNKNEEIKEPINDINVNENLIDNKSDEDKNALLIKDIVNGEDDKVITDKDFIGDNEEMPKLNFFDFVFSGLYDGKCCKLSIKELIKKCNEIISKYYSIEHIIYNQIKLENILKDYRWNNPQLNNFGNNELIEQLKNLISSFNNN